MRSLKNLLVGVLLVLQTFSVSAQDSLSSKPPKVKAYLLPTALIISGVALNGSTFEKDFKNDIRNSVGQNYYLAVDDYAQYAPIVMMGIANVSHVNARNHWFDQAKYLAISNVLVSAITHGLKRAIDKERPNGERYAFPSGHTSFAFTNAMVLYKEYQDTSPFLAYSGFAFAGTTGAFRIINNKHWLSDVLAGAGIAILITELVYHFEPLKEFNPFKGQDKLSVLPNLGPGKSLGLSLSIHL